MKQLILILLIIFITPDFLFCQELIEKKKLGKESFIGIKAGLFLSKYGKGKEYGSVPLGNPSGIEIAYENKFKAGFIFGLFFEVLKTNHFSLLPEINYTSTEHDINYYKWSISGAVNTKYSGNYVLTSSVIQLCIIPEFTVGKNSNVQLLIGPYIWIPVSSHYQGQIEKLTYNIVSKTGSPVTLNASDEENIVRGGIGGICGLRIDIPFKTNVLAVEIRACRGLTDITSSPNMKETSVVLSLIYLRELR